MHQTQFPKILAFVEGSMERLFINSSFHYVHVISVKNGISWALSALCMQIETRFKALNAYPDKVIVWIDRESRHETSLEIRDAIEDTLLKAGVEVHKICVLVCDKMTENIILADEKLIAQEFSLNGYEYTFKGKNGKSILRNMYSENGISYKEMKHGVDLMKRMRISRSAATCAEIDHFFQRLGLPCWWLTEAQ